ncbi:hypothetical protein [Marinoscillum pacificum]|uniref:hypothetical protein n=1 Tax=Marinoscillum pacificum TaxID=392723 RepID=UPI0021573DB7|nr:hypothetical protein [Marinoscillum pacificum]
MNKVLSYIFLAGMALFAISCAEPVAPNAGGVRAGDWIVQEYYVDGQLAAGGGNDIIYRLTLELDDSFLLTDQNGVLTIGTWDATETTLTLTGEDGTVLDFAIVYNGYSKMHLLQTISGSTTGTIEIRYLMDWNNANDY